MYGLDTSEYFVSRNVKFHENKFPFVDLTSEHVVDDLASFPSSPDLNPPLEDFTELPSITPQQIAVATSPSPEPTMPASPSPPVIAQLSSTVTTLLRTHDNVPQASTI